MWRECITLIITLEHGFVSPQRAPRWQTSIRYLGLKGADWGHQNHVRRYSKGSESSFSYPQGTVITSSWQEILTIFTGHLNALIQKLLKNYCGTLRLVDGMIKLLLNTFDHDLRPARRCSGSAWHHTWRPWDLSISKNEVRTEDNASGDQVGRLETQQRELSDVVRSIPKNAVCFAACGNDSWRLYNNDLSRIYMYLL